MSTTRNRDYRDLDLDFIAHPATKDVTKKTGPDAVIRSIRNLVLTNFWDRPFRSYIGSNAQKLLFENMTPITANLLEEFIKETIDNFEPRASLIGVKVNPDFDNNGYTAKIVFSIINRPEPYTATIFLERVR